MLGYLGLREWVVEGLSRSPQDSWSSSPSWVYVIVSKIFLFLNSLNASFTLFQENLGQFLLQFHSLYSLHCIACSLDLSVGNHFDYLALEYRFLLSLLIMLSFIDSSQHPLAYPSSSSLTWTAWGISSSLDYLSFLGYRSHSTSMIPWYLLVMVQSAPSQDGLVLSLDFLSHCVVLLMKKLWFVDSSMHIWTPSFCRHRLLGWLLGFSWTILWRWTSPRRIEECHGGWSLGLLEETTGMRSFTPCPSILTDSSLQHSLDAYPGTSPFLFL